MLIRRKRSSSSKMVRKFIAAFSFLCTFSLKLPSVSHNIAGNALHRSDYQQNLSG